MLWGVGFLFLLFPLCLGKPLPLALVFVVLRVSGLLTSGDSWRTRAINYRADLGKAGQETLYLMSPWEGK